MKSNTEISVVVPLYNVEQNLRIFFPGGDFSAVRVGATSKILAGIWEVYMKSSSGVVKLIFLGS